LFERESRYRVRVIAVGSGQALEMGRRGDADLVLSHAPEAERALMDSGYFIRRRLVMHNQFIIVGPADDPAGIRGLHDAVAAFARIASQQSPFASRGDKSGTHLRELSLWRRANISPAPPDGWYIEGGQGMGATLQLASEKRAYTLTDDATYLAWRDKIALIPMVKGDSLLYNVYHVLEVNPRNAARINGRGGRALANFFVAPATQQRIAEFGKARYGQSLFVPDAGKPDRW
jgi:tungstate transport system substrate-binding protein